MQMLTLLMIVVLGGSVACTTTQPPNAGPNPNVTGNQNPNQKPEVRIASSAHDEAAVRATVAEFANAWNDHDMKRMRDLLADDVLWILRNGNVWRGKEQVYEAYSELQRAMAADAPAPNTSMHPLIIEKMEVRILAPQLAVVTTRMRFGRGNEEFHSRDSFVMAMTGAGWKIVHFHSTTIHPAVVANDRPDFGETK